MGCKEEAEAFAQVVCPKGYQVLSIDLPAHGERQGRGEELTPWEAVPDVRAAWEWTERRWNTVSLRANSIGAYFSMLAIDRLDRALLVSPILDMEGLILTMMGWAGVTEEELRTCIEDVESLVKAGKLYTPDTFADMAGTFKERSGNVVKALCLHVAHTCNLNCAYCFASQGKYHGERALMSFEVGKQALDFLIQNSGTRTNLEVDFFGGEPLMNWDVVKELEKPGRDPREEMPAPIVTDRCAGDEGPEGRHGLKGDCAKCD